MQYDEFIGQVQHRAQLASSGEAVAATRATLETLAERLAGGAPDNLAAQLSPEIARFLVDWTPLAGESFDRNEFFHRVNRREGNFDLPKSMHHARVVIGVLCEAVSEGEVQKIRAQLPSEFDPLFEPNGASQNN